VVVSRCPTKYGGANELFLEEGGLLFGCEDIMTWDKRVVGDVHKEVRLGELFEFVGVLHAVDNLWTLCQRRERS
jgi:hypothetical protein